MRNPKSKTSLLHTQKRNKNKTNKKKRVQQIGQDEIEKVAQIIAAKEFAESHQKVTDSILSLICDYARLPISFDMKAHGTKVVINSNETAILQKVDVSWKSGSSIAISKDTLPFVYVDTEKYATICGGMYIYCCIYVYSKYILLTLWISEFFFAVNSTNLFFFCVF